MNNTTNNTARLAEIDAFLDENFDAEWFLDFRYNGVTTDTDSLGTIGSAARLSDALDDAAESADEDDALSYGKGKHTIVLRCENLDVWTVHTFDHSPVQGDLFA